MRKLYLVFAFVGFVIPASFVPATFEHGNMLLMADPSQTLELLFANYASAAFSADLLWVFVVFCAWVMLESHRRGLKHSWAFVLLALLFGVSGPFPLFLYWRERAEAGR